VFGTRRWGFQNYVEIFLNMKKRKVYVAEEETIGQIDLDFGSFAWCLKGKGV